ncbi:oligosaccharide flippase family protein [uncultured Tenacibaculum sp.]|uniref:oligosaccharide flippase family protein n=1 Tax=uncultured Tenacibaculum sp. TaxID=174713 RepID=UPI002628AC66|nr:oligosaccharide flippase family protein [uncultured Tenacibaculum sp.]
MSELIFGFKWNFISQAHKVLFSSLILIILSRLIDVEDFGIIGIASVFILFFNTLLNIGFDSSIIYSKNFKETHLFSIFILNVLIGLFIYVISFFSSFFIAEFYENLELVKVIQVLSLSVIFSSLGIVSKGYLQKKIDFKKLALVDILSTTIAGIIALFLALKNYGFWSLVVLQLVTVGLSSIGYLIITFNKVFISKNIYLRVIKEHLNFGYNVFIFNIINFFAQQSDILLIGKLLGEKEVGIYMLAFNILLKPFVLLTQIFNKTIYPILTKLKENKISSAYISYTNAFFFFISPLIIFIIFIGQYLVPILLTDKWTGILPIITIFAYQAIRTLIASPSGLLFLVTGNPNKQWKYSTVISIPLRFIGILIGYLSFKSAMGILIGINFFATIEMFIGFYITFKLIDLDIKSYFSYFKSDFINLILFTIVLLIINISIPTTYWPLILICQITTLILFIYKEKNNIKEKYYKISVVS